MSEMYDGGFGEVKAGVVGFWTFLYFLKDQREFPT